MEEIPIKPIVLSLSITKMKRFFSIIFCFLFLNGFGQYATSSRGIGFGAAYQMDILGRNIENFQNSGRMQSFGVFIQPKDFIQIGIQRHVLLSNQTNYFTSSFFGQLSLPVFRGKTIFRDTWAGRRSNIPIGVIRINPTIVVNRFFTKKDFGFTQDFNSIGGGLQFQFQPNRAKHKNSESRQTSLYLLAKKTQNPENFIPNQTEPNLWFFGAKLDFALFKMR